MKRKPRPPKGTNRKRRVPRNGKCPATGKQRFTTRRAAIMYASRMPGKGEGYAHRAYRCPIEACGDWHLTTNPKRKGDKN